MHTHSHGTVEGTSKVLRVSLGVTLAYIVLLVVAGLRAHSLALLSEAGHNLSDFVALLRAYGVAAVMADHATHPLLPDPTASFVYLRLQGASEEEDTGYSPAALKLWAERAQTWAAGKVPTDIPLIARRAERTRKDTRRLLGIDGEAVTLPVPVRCAVRPGALRVRVPRGRPGVPAPKPELDWVRLVRLAGPGHGRPPTGTPEARGAQPPRVLR